jgi:DNA polymerase-3 subunit alpha
MSLLETVKQNLTRSVEINMHAAMVTPDFVNFFDRNVKSNPGKASLKFNIIEPKDNLKITLSSFERGFQMNEEMAGFLMDNPDVDVHVGVVTKD